MRPPSIDAFVNELALGWQRMMLYQPGHPVRAEALAEAMRILRALLAPLGELALGVARDGLIAPDERLASPPARKLATALYEAGIGVLRLREGIEPGELDSFLNLLPRHAGWTMARPMWEQLQAAGAVHVVAEPLDFSQVLATDTLDEVSIDGDGGEPMWDQILRKLLADERFGSAAAAASPQGASLAEVLRVLNDLARRYGAVLPPADGAGVGTGDQLAALGGFLASVLAGHLAGRREETTRRSTLFHLAELLGAIPNGLRDRLLDSAVVQLMGSDDTAPELEAIAGSVTASQMVRSLRRLREQRVALAPRAQRLVEELATAAAIEMAPETAGDPDEVADKLRELFAEEDVDRVGHGEIDRLVLALPRITAPRAPSSDLDERLEGLVEDRQLASLAGLLLELLQSPVLDAEMANGVARRIESVLRGLLLATRVRAAVNLVERLQAISASPSAPPAAQQATAACLERLRQRAATADLLAALRDAADGLPLLQRLVALLGPGFVEQLLLALAEEDDLAKRRQTFQLLTGLGADVGPQALVLLRDERWFVVRNMLALLRQTKVAIPLSALQPSLVHSDARVRAEAVKCVGNAARALPSELLSRLVHDSDERVSEAVVGLIGAHRLPAGRDILLALLRQPDPLGRNRGLRVKALHALGEIGDPRALEELRPLFRSWLPSGSAEERRAAFASLGGYPLAIRQPLLQQGLRARDPELRALCQRLLATPSNGKPRERP